ncbi:MAG: LOG family protein [Proteobacteria bacterium]|nr:LOG family protein [Pseudomonadota bacterium]NOG59938.1 LOG family protein [Pseudomonadota bacterium]
MNGKSVDVVISPVNGMDVLSKVEVSRLLDTSQSGLFSTFRNCALAVLNSGVAIDDSKQLFEKYSSFDIRVLQVERGIKLQLTGAPATAFVDGKIIRGIKEHLYAVLRDIVYVFDEIRDNPNVELETSEGISNAVFHILRNADVLQAGVEPNLVVCWGGHAIVREEYEYCKEVGYELGLRGFDICTGCGPGAMKAPMKGANVAHAKQRIRNGIYLGITEPGIIAAESPNPMVNQLVIMPDIEKRLEAFVRCAHAVLVFPGGVGTTEEILYLLGILLHPDNEKIPFPLIFVGPESSRNYFEQINEFVISTLGSVAQEKYKIIINDPVSVAKEVKKGIAEVKEFRIEHGDAFYFNWLLKIKREFQFPFIANHDNMRSIELYQDMEPHILAANLRRAFSGIVAGNVKSKGMREIEEHGLFEIHGDENIMGAMDKLLSSFVEQKRMKISAESYKPCYRIVR